MGECSGDMSNDETIALCTNLIPINRKLIHALDTKFSELPSCEDIDQQLKQFLTSVRSLRTTKDSGYVSDPLVSNTVKT